MLMTYHIGLMFKMASIVQALLTGCPYPNHLSNAHPPQHPNPEGPTPRKRPIHPWRSDVQGYGVSQGRHGQGTDMDLYRGVDGMPDKRVPVQRGERKRIFCRSEIIKNSYYI